MASALCCFVLKFLKIDKKNRFKICPKIHHKFHCFHRFFVDFSLFFRPSWPQNSLQNRLKINPKINQKNYTILSRIFIDVWAIWTDSGRPRGGPRRVHEPTFGGLFGSWNQDGPQPLPRRPRDPILNDFCSILADFCLSVADVWSIFDWCLVGFCLIFGVDDDDDGDDDDQCGVADHPMVMMMIVV